MESPPNRSPLLSVLADRSENPYRIARWYWPLVVGSLWLSVAGRQADVRSAEPSGDAASVRQELPSSEPEGLQPSGVQLWVDAIYRHDLQPLAASSCAGSGCHGGPHPGVARPVDDGQSAYGLWLERDPHARSWESVSGPAGLAMLTRLGILDGDQVLDREGLNNCLACHNSHRAEPTELAISTAASIPAHSSSIPSQAPCPSAGPATTPDISGAWVEAFEPRHTEGVACASCHGPAERWLHSHYAAGFDAQAATADGFVLTRDLVVRARLCASCHVGDHDRDMNHDIIAAGHPALRFEMASHHARLPKHWREPLEQDPAAMEAQLWTAGAIASADAWLALQQGRAQQSTAVSTWPEFAAYDCGSCHQTLRLNSDRRPLADVQQRGAAKMSLWDLAPLMYWAQADLAAGNADGTASANERLDAVAALRQQLEIMAVPSRPEFTAHAAALRGQLPALANPPAFGRWQPPPFAPAPVSIGLVELMRLASSQADPAASWETASHFYLLLAASRHQWPPAVQAELIAQSQAMRRGLSLPEGYDSPRFELRHPIGPELNRQEMTQRIRLFLDTLEGVNARSPSRDLSGQPPLPERVGDGASPFAQSPEPANPGPVKPGPANPGPANPGPANGVSDARGS